MELYKNTKKHINTEILKRYIKYNINCIFICRQQSERLSSFIFIRISLPLIRKILFWMWQSSDPPLLLSNGTEVSITDRLSKSRPGILKSLAWLQQGTKSETGLKSERWAKVSIRMARSEGNGLIRDFSSRLGTKQGNIIGTQWVRSCENNWRSVCNPESDWV